MKIVSEIILESVHCSQRYNQKSNALFLRHYSRLFAFSLSPHLRCLQWESPFVCHVWILLVTEIDSMYVVVTIYF